jgi:hypothetical protein
MSTDLFKVNKKLTKFEKIHEKLPYFKEVKLSSQSSVILMTGPLFHNNLRMNLCIKVDKKTNAMRI